MVRRPIDVIGLDAAPTTSLPAAPPDAGASSWVLLRGLTREAAHWGVFADLLRAALPSARVVAVDLPGAGRLREMACPMRIESIVDCCRGQLREAAVPPPYRLVGLSMGGLVAAAWARAHQGEVAACCLINSSMRPFSAPHRRLRPAALPALLGILAAFDGGRAEDAILRLTSLHPERHAAALQQWHEIRRQRPVSRANALRQLCAAARYRDAGSAPPVPTLLLASAGDRLVDPDCSRALARHWGSRLVLHPDAGHDLALDAAPWLVAELTAWAARR